MIANRNKGQFSAIELVLLILLFAFSSTYFAKPISSTEQDYKVSIDSAIDAIYYSDDYRDIIMNENLGVAHLVEDWSVFNNTVNKMFYNFEVKLSDDSNTKTIFSCQHNYTKMYLTERVFAIKDDSSFGMRKLRLGVCY